MEIKTIITQRFVKSEDLNHHGTLFAGRTAEWFVEAGLMAAAAYLAPENIVCAKIHGMDFAKPIKLGEIAKFTAKVVHAGRTSVVSNVLMTVEEKAVLNGFMTFVNVDADGRPMAHGLVIEAKSAEDLELQEKAKSLPRS